AAAIYTARKGLDVALVTNRVGGQVNETTGIENLVSVARTTGPQLAADLRKHVEDYGVHVYDNRTIDRLDDSGETKAFVTTSGERFEAPQAVIATGAAWRRLGVPGEAEYTGRGVAFCPHCDGPFYRGRDVAVVGGGNSGVEAAIDLAGICRAVTLIEFMDSLKADAVLREKLAALPNTSVRLHTETLEALGDGKRLTGLRLRDRLSGDESTLAVDGVFVQIGLTPNSAPFAGTVETNRAREIVTDRNGRTSRPGIYAAGDVTDVTYKQIVIAMGEGAKAALAAFDDRMKGR
ncbi:MAG TPA: FAD-dependent oxidoreductase, partial [Candidatus Caccomonas pullistercoris]|nr:FAD-dependent oxidoreductase [Candidatus Caccomonas pullistercoris]